MTPEVRTAFASFPAQAQPGLRHLRKLILTQAATLPQIGPVVEALRWGQPAFLTPETRAACSLRIGMAKDDFALFVHCRTELIDSFIAGPGTGMRVQGTRAVLFRAAAEIDDTALAFLIRGALTYHQPK